MTAAIALLVLPAAMAAAAERPEELIQFPGDGLAGAAAGQTDLPGALAASPLSGDVFVADRLNGRVDVFSAWGVFERAFGWNVNAAAPAEELQVCTAVSGCQKASQGNGDGQFGNLRGGIAIDGAGNVYVGDMDNRRVQKFSEAGEFLLAFGSAGSGDGQFSSEEAGSYIAVSPDDATVYVGDKDRIQAFAPDGSFKTQYTFKSLHEEVAVFPEAATVRALAVDPTSGNLYLALNAAAGRKEVFKLNPATGKLTGSLAAPTMERPTELATDSEGNLYVISNGEALFDRKEILKFDAAGNKLIPDQAEEEAFKVEQEAKDEGKPFDPVPRFGEPEDGTRLLGLATNSGCESESDDLYVGHFGEGFSYIKAYGPPPQNVAKCPPPPPQPPQIDAQYATAVGTDSAVVRAEINPRYALDATYFVQYGTGKCSEGGCDKEKPLAPGTSLPSKVSSSALRTSPVLLTGLTPGTTYNYRFVATSSGGGPVRGVGGEVGVDGAEASFTVYPAPGNPFENCPNQALRNGGASARLVDCRAYELVSPAQRSPAGDIVTGLNGLQYPAELNQSSSDGDKLTYSAEYAFADSLGAPIVSQYIASRKAGEGWSTHAISPPRESEMTNKNPNIKVDLEEKAFTSDLCRGWLMHATDPPLSQEGIAGWPNLYRRENCGANADSYESLTAVIPITTSTNYWPELQGFSSDGSRAAFRVAGKLTADAPDLGSAYQLANASQLYVASAGGPLRFACRLPDGSVHVGPCSAGTPGSVPGGEGRTNNVARALSGDGERLYWSASGSGAGTLYLRENVGEEQSEMDGGNCSEAAKACSFAVSSGTGRFFTGSVDGSRVLYGEGENLREYDAETKKSKLVAGGLIGVAGASEDLSRFYFASEKRVGGEGVVGEPNLYLSDEGETALVAVLADEDLSENFKRLPLNPVAIEPMARGARVSPDGRQLVFASTAVLSTYDNRDANDGRRVSEVYLYEAGSVGPVCISCNPSGARATSRQVPGANNTSRGVAALIPVAYNQLRAPRILSDDGSRVFFESFEPLVVRDANDKGDVYEWERANDQAGCEAIGAELFVPASGGCLSLISSGLSSSDSTFVDSSSSGRDVFFKTAASLVDADKALIDIYDAREGGGFAEPVLNPPCEGGACQNPPQVPEAPAPASETPGPGNPKQGKPKACPKGKQKVKRAGKVRCVKKKNAGKAKKSRGAKR